MSLNILIPKFSGKSLDLRDFLKTFEKFKIFYR